LFSTITWFFMRSVSCCAMTRAAKSDPPPGAKPTTIFTGLDGIGLRLRTECAER